MTAKIILDSVGPDGQRVTTMQVTMHRFVLAEFNTHRVFSRNSASSRAIPLKKQIERIVNDPAIPVSFPKEQSGMQGGEELGPEATKVAKAIWVVASESAMQWAAELGKLGVHKSVANRLLEPFMWHEVIVTSTEWKNFFALRCNPLAQPEIRVVAEQMREVYEDSTPQPLSYADWHMPYVTGYDFDDLVAEYGGDAVNVGKMCSAARCARVSYLTHDNTKDVSKDLILFNRLANPGEGPPHSSPMEHVCIPSYGDEPGNLYGFRQFRHEVEYAR